MGRRLDRWRALGWRERRQLLLIAITLPCIDVLLRVFGYRQLLAWIERAMPQRGVTPDLERGIATGKVLAAQAALASAGIPLFNTSCLRQSLLVYWRLRRLGLAPVLQLGIRPLPGKLDAHAWVELDGTALQNGPVQHQAFTLPDHTHPPS